jgi:hypothetical protein
VWRAHSTTLAKQSVYAKQVREEQFNGCQHTVALSTSPADAASLHASATTSSGARETSHLAPSRSPTALMARMAGGRCGRRCEGMAAILSGSCGDSHGSRRPDTAAATAAAATTHTADRSDNIAHEGWPSPPAVPLPSLGSALRVFCSEEVEAAGCALLPFDPPPSASMNSSSFAERLAGSPAALARRCSWRYGDSAMVYASWTRIWNRTRIPLHALLCTG